MPSFQSRHCLECGGELVLAFQPRKRRATVRHPALRREQTKDGGAAPADMNSLLNSFAPASVSLREVRAEINLYRRPWTVRLRQLKELSSVKTRTLRYAHG